jgi:5-methyltetrahydrofolate--homocysteine methyltransferase
LNEWAKTLREVLSEWKLAVARRSYKLLTDKSGLGLEDTIFDPLLFPWAIGDENYIGGAMETVEGYSADQAGLAGCTDDLGNSECVVRLASGRARW